MILKTKHKEIIMKINKIVFLSVLVLSSLSQAQVKPTHGENMNFIRCEGFENKLPFFLDVNLKLGKAQYFTEQSEENVFLIGAEENVYKFSTEDMCAIDGLVFKIDINNMKIKLHREDYYSGKLSTSGDEFSQIKCFYNIF